MRSRGTGAGVGGRGRGAQVWEQRGQGAEPRGTGEHPVGEGRSWGDGGPGLAKFRPGVWGVDVQLCHGWTRGEHLAPPTSLSDCGQTPREEAEILSGAVRGGRSRACKPR